MENNPDIGSMLSSLLSDPATLSKVMSIAGELGKELGTNQSEGTEATPASAEAAPEMNESKQEKEEGAEAFAKSDGGIPDLSTLSALSGLLGGGSKKHDPRCELLKALRPYMGHGRAEKIDTMIKALGLAELAGGFLKNQKLF